MSGARISWEPASDDWMGGHGFMEWQCTACGKPITVSWSANCDLYDTDEPIEAKDAITNSWQVECHGGHVLLLCYELADNECSDTFVAPTTKQIALKLATLEDIAAWQEYAPPKPPWTK